jgi:hypothetical protein
MNEKSASIVSVEGLKAVTFEHPIISAINPLKHMITIQQLL